MEEKILKYFLDVIAAGGTAGLVTFGLFKWLGQNWMENRFKKSLEAYRHEQNKELEQYKQKVNALFRRITKIHEKEFEVLPIAWQKLMDAYGNVSAIVSVYQEYPNLNVMGESRLKEFLGTSKFSQSHMDEIIEARDKNVAYQNIVFWYILNDALANLNDFHNYLLYNKIFLSSDLFLKFREIDNLLSAALLDIRAAKESPELKLRQKAYRDIKDKSESIIVEIENLVQKRLHYREAE
jgi:hypothetical protein